MPNRALRPCAVPGCPNLVRSGRCDQHRDARPAQASVDERERHRLYGRKWQAARRRYLNEHPFCDDCLAGGAYTPATEVHHVTPHRGDASLFWDDANWCALCKVCHSRHTSRETRGRGGKNV